MWRLFHKPLQISFLNTENSIDSEQPLFFFSVAHMKFQETFVPLAYRAATRPLLGCPVGSAGKKVRISGLYPHNVYPP